MGGRALTICRDLELRCAVCGADSVQSITDGFDLSMGTDLDQRPRPMSAQELEHLVMRCPGCGYCATNISVDAGVTRQMVDDPDYRSILEADREDVLNSFIAKGYLMERTGYFIGAFDAYRSASWFADDRGDAEAAKEMRGKAIDACRVFIERMVPGGRIVYGDMLRRVGRFDECVKVMDGILSSDAPEDAHAVARLEKSLCAAGDAGCHSTSEAVKH